MNLWGFTPDIFDHLAAGLRRFALESGNDPTAESLLPDQVLDAVAAGRRVRAYRTDSSWYGVTYAQDLAPVAALFETVQDSYP
jgi:NDP-sugar pyrophosphorylase family protein